MNTIPASIAPHSATAPATRPGIAAALLLVLLAGSGPAAGVSLPQPELRASLELDIGRIGRINETERELLRDEWLLAQGQGDGSRLVAELMERIIRLEGTTKELGRALAAVPDWRSATAPPAAAPAASPMLQYGASAALALLAGLAGAWFGRRRAGTTNPAVAPTVPESPSANTAVPSRLTFAETPAAKSLPATDLPAAAPHDPPMQPARPAPPVQRPVPFLREIDFTPSTERGMGDTVILDSPIPARQAPNSTAIPPVPPVPPAAPLPTSDAVPTGGVFAGADEIPEEDEQALELAEIMLSMGLASGAAQTLSEHIRANPKRALYHWLKLLDIHRKTGDVTQFESAANELRQYFNIQADGWAPAEDGREPGLENYARIIDQIQTTWRQPAECQAYLAQLLEDNRGGTRMGFPRPVAEEILLLREVLKQSTG